MLSKFEIIVADPPWTYRDKCNAGERGAAHKYECMTLPEIMQLPVNSLAAENCALFMWATFPMLPDASRCFPMLFR